MINSVVLVGRLTRDPVIRKTTSGRSAVSFNLAVDRKKSNAQDANAPTADFIPCVAWNNTADLLAMYCHKGSQVGVNGRVQTRNYDDPNNPGKKVFVTEIVVETLTFLGSRNDSAAVEQSQPEAYTNDYQNEASYDLPYNNSFDNAVSSDDLPF